MENISSPSLPRLSMNRINHYFKLARNACYYSDNAKARLGAVLVYKNKVLSVGWNQNKTAPIQKRLNAFRDFDPNASYAYNSLHAEVSCLSAIMGLDIDWSKTNLFVYRIKKNGDSGYARPCKGCQALIKSLGIKNVYYSCDDNGWAYERMGS